MSYTLSYRWFITQNSCSAVPTKSTKMVSKEYKWIHSSCWILFSKIHFNAHIWFITHENIYLLITKILSPGPMNMNFIEIELLTCNSIMYQRWIWPYFDKFGPTKLLVTNYCWLLRHEPKESWFLFCVFILGNAHKSVILFESKSRKRWRSLDYVHSYLGHYLRYAHVNTRFKIVDENEDKRNPEDL